MERVHLLCNIYAEELKMFFRPDNKEIHRPSEMFTQTNPFGRVLLDDLELRIPPKHLKFLTHSTKYPGNAEPRGFNLASQDLFNLCCSRF